MSKLEKLTTLGATQVDINGTKLPQLLNYEAGWQLVDKINEAIDHITALASEVDRLKGHTHEVDLDDIGVVDTTMPATTPPTMETDKQ